MAFKMESIMLCDSEGVYGDRTYRFCLHHMKRQERYGETFSQSPWQPESYQSKSAPKCNSQTHHHKSGRHDLKGYPPTQREMAAMLQVSDSTICRIIRKC